MSDVETNIFEPDVSSIPPPPTTNVKSEEHSTPSNLPRALRLKLLLILMMALAIVTFRLLPSDPLIAKRMEMLLHPAKTPTADIDSSLLRIDPPLNTFLPLNAVGTKIRAQTPKSRVGYLLVPVGSCGSCLGVDLHAWQVEATQRGVSLVLFSSAPPDRAAQFLHDQNLHAPLIYDPGSQMEHKLNAVWLARPYLFSPDWRFYGCRVSASFRIHRLRMSDSKRP